MKKIGFREESPLYNLRAQFEESYEYAHRNVSAMTTALIFTAVGAFGGVMIGGGAREILNEQPLSADSITVGLGGAVIVRGIISLAQYDYSVERREPSPLLPLIRPSLVTAGFTAAAIVVSDTLHKKTGLGIPADQFPVVATALTTGAVAFAPSIARIAGMLKRGSEVVQEKATRAYISFAYR
jgi:hypothetical protein